MTEPALAAEVETLFGAAVVRAAGEIDLSNSLRLGRAWPSRVSGASLFGKTIETVLVERPWCVIIESTSNPPKARRLRRRPALGDG